MIRKQIAGRWPWYTPCLQILNISQDRLKVDCHFSSYRTSHGGVVASSLLAGWALLMRSVVSSAYAWSLASIPS
jgi:hypothetical protein